ncbi:DUF4031 domain-containing protein [Variovorax sp. E3]|uniref:DUF4031 domain-containing protein n=1 Tax=Variovorax sp. E3 TaxID=1914993 RepID=UPI0027DE44F2|nr:DUF4031 domain-containing protein [Variovorax sp. E3]
MHIILQFASMAVYVDDEQVPWRGKLWCHLVADTLGELHGFARRLGLREAWFQSQSTYPHYDVTVSIRARALSMGAMPGDRRTMITCAKVLRQQLSVQRPAMSQCLLFAEEGPDL